MGVVWGRLLRSLLQGTVAPGRKQPEALSPSRRASGPGAAIIGEIRSTQNVERTIQLTVVGTSKYFNSQDY